MKAENVLETMHENSKKMKILINEDCIKNKIHDYNKSEDMNSCKHYIG